MADPFDSLPMAGAAGGGDPFAALPDLAKPKDESGFWWEAGKGVLGGATSATGSAIKGIAGGQELDKADRTGKMKAILDAIAKIDRREEVDLGAISDPYVAEQVSDYMNQPEDEKARRREGFTKMAGLHLAQPVQETDLYKTGQKVQEFGEKTFGASDAYKDSWTRALTEGLGSTIPVFGAAVLTRGGGATAGFSMSAGEAIDRAIQGGATKEQILKAISVGGVPGMTEEIPFDQLLNRIPIGRWGKVMETVIKIGATAAEEGGQEAVQQAMQNVIEKYVYDPKQDISEGVLENALIGAAVGGIIATPTAPFTSKGTQVETPAAPPADMSQASPAGAIIPDVFDELPPVAAAPVAESMVVETPKIMPAPQAEKDARITSTRLTPEDRASPIPNDIIDDGKKAIEEATGVPPTVTTAEISPTTGKLQVVDKPVEEANEERRTETAALVDQVMAGVTPDSRAGPMTMEITGDKLPDGTIQNPQPLPGGRTETTPAPTEAPPASVPPVPAPVQRPAAPGSTPRAPVDEDDYLSARQMRQEYDAQYTDKDGNKVVSSRKEPSLAPIPPTGSWRIDDLKGNYGREIEQLREVPIADLVLPELEDGKLAPHKRGDDDRYAGWLQEGKEPPPIEVIRTEDGKLKVADGHRRTLAAQKAGQTTIKAWVSELAPTGKTDSNGKPMTTGLTYELATGKTTDKLTAVSKPTPKTEAKSAPKVEAKPEPKPEPKAKVEEKTEAKPAEKKTLAEINNSLSAKRVQPVKPTARTVEQRGDIRLEQEGRVALAFQLRANAKDKANKLFRELRAELDRVGLKDVALEVSEAIKAMVDGNIFPIAGRYHPIAKVIDVAMNAKDAKATLHHEALHALYAMGLFSPLEWKMLSRRAEESWIKEHNIKRDYPWANHETHIEEGIAHAYDKWVEGRKYDSITERAFRKIRAALLAFYTAMTKHDIRSPEDVFEDVYRGKLGKRREQQAKGDGESKFQTASIRRGEETMAAFGLEDKKKYNTRAVAAALEARQRKKYGTIKRGDYSPKALEAISNWMVDETMFEVDQAKKNPKKSAVGWYSKKYQDALDQLAVAFPEFRKGSNTFADASLPGVRILKTPKNARDFFTALMAITSDGAKVKSNFQFASAAYEHFRQTGKIKTDVTYGGERNKSMQLNLGNVQKMLDVHGPDQMAEALLRKDTVSNLKKAAKAAGDDFNVAYKANMLMPHSAIVFGPKLGAFYANLMGDTGYLTMDRWWSRTFNRYRGTLLTQATRAGLERFKGLVGLPESTSDDEVINATVPHVKSYKAKDYKNGTEVEKAANTLYKAATEGLEDQPFSASDREFMINTTIKAQEKLKSKDVELTIADIQAVLWYYEKRLYGELGARQTQDVSYEDIAREVAARRDSAEGSADQVHGVGQGEGNLDAAGTGTSAREVATDEVAAGSDREAGTDRGRAVAGKEGKAGERAKSVEPLPNLYELYPKSVGPSPAIAGSKENYLRSRKMPLRRQAEYANVDPVRAARIADAFEAMPHDPTNKETKRAYKAMIEETVAQFHQLEKDLGLKIEFIKPGQKDPYRASPRMALEDVRDNGHLWVFPTADGFGSGDIISDNPLLEQTDIVVDGHKLVANDVFRIVHDIYGHGSEGAGFGAVGEENAWQSHVRMYSPLAARAMTTETRGQNSWVNYGPFGEKNRANPKQTTYADQKIGLLPEWVSSEGVVDDVLSRFMIAPSTREMLDKADDALPDDAQRAISDFVGHGPRSREKTDMEAFGFMHAKALEAAARGENPKLADAIEKAFTPVREALRATFGNTVRLYRKQSKVEPREDGTIVMGFPEDGHRAILSWTVEPKVAEAFSGARKDMRVYSEEEIAAFEKEHAETGKVKIGRHEFRETNNYTKFDGTPGSSINFYDGEEMVTDTGSIREYVEGENEWAREHNETQALKRAGIVTAEVPLEQVMWVTDRAGQEEFIVRNSPTRDVYIDETGTLRTPETDVNSMFQVEEVSKPKSKEIHAGDGADPRFHLIGAPQQPSQKQSVTQGFIQRGQPIDRALRTPWALLGGINSDGAWKLGKRLSDKLGPQGRTAAGIGGILGAGIGSFVTPGIGTFIGGTVGGSVGAYLMTVSPNPQGRFGWMASVAENAKRGLIDGYGLDEMYVEVSKEAELDKARILRKAQGILQVLNNAGVGTREAEVLQAILTGEPVNDADMARLAVPIRQAIDDLGAEAVSLGLISAESYDRNRGAYLHRVYTKNEVDQNNLAGWVSKQMATRRKRIIGDQLKGRGMFWEQTMERLTQDFGQHSEPVKGDKVIVIDRTAGGKVNKRVFLPANKPIPMEFSGAGWVNRGNWEVREINKRKEVTLWRDYTKDERVQMGELVDARYTIAKTFMLMANDLSTGRFYREVAAKSEWTSSTPPATPWKEAAEYGRFWTDPEIGWVKVPDTEISSTGGKKRWGALAGKFVRAEIWRDLNEVDQAQRPSTYRKLLTIWKLNKTARNPVVHMNNIMSNVLFMDLADVRMQDLVAGIKAYATGNADYQEAVDNGAFGADMISQEIRDQVLKPILEEITKQTTGASTPFLSAQGGTFLAKAQTLSMVADKLWTWAKTADRKMIEAYGAEDELFRMAMYLRRRSQGHSPKVAAREARDQFLNYDIRAPWVVAMRNTLLPFISYTYRAVPKLMENISHRPWKLAKYFAVAYAVNALSYMFDDGDDGEDRERAALRDEEQGNTWLGIPRMVRMPFRDSHGLPVFFDVRRWVPAGDIFDTSQGNAALPIPSPLLFGGPIQLAFEFRLNTQAFTGEDITDDLTMDNGDKFTTVADWAWKSWAPASLWTPGSWYWTKMSNAIYGATDTAGRPYSVPQALLSSFGIKAKSQDVEDGIGWHYYDFQKVQRALKKELQSAGRQRERGLMSQAAFESRSADIMEKFGNLKENVNEFKERTRKPPK